MAKIIIDFVFLPFFLYNLNINLVIIWLNIKFEDKKIRRQSKFYDIYEHFLKKLRDLNLIYPCWATRSEIKKSIIQNKNSYRNWNIDPDGQYIYPGIYKNISSAERSGLMLSG